MPAATKLSEIVALRIEGKKQHAKRSIFWACTLLIENHILPSFGEMMLVEEQDVQTFVFRKLDEGLSQKIVKEILIVLKTRTCFGVKKQKIPCLKGFLQGAFADKGDVFFREGGLPSQVKIQAKAEQAMMMSITPAVARAVSRSESLMCSNFISL